MLSQRIFSFLRKPGAKKLKASMTMIGPASISIVHSKLAKKQKPKELKNLPGRLTCEDVVNRIGSERSKLRNPSLSTLRLAISRKMSTTRTTRAIIPATSVVNSIKPINDKKCGWKHSFIEKRKA